MANIKQTFLIKKFIYTFLYKLFIYLCTIIIKQIEIMTIEINKTLSKSGRRVMWFPTVEGKRITRTNFGKKWEAQNLAKLYLEIQKQKENN